MTRLEFVPPPRSAWSIPEDVTYLNHGSLGPAPRVVQESREEWSRRLERQPMDFYLRQMEPALDQAMEKLSRFVGADSRDMVFVDNATVAMNIVADSTPLNAGDEVLLNDHEYGAVFRIWRQRCDQAGARLVTARLGTTEDNGTSPGGLATAGRIQNTADVIDPIFRCVTERTKLIVISHITSPSAIIFPVIHVCQKARDLGIPVCIDGPHAIAMRSVNLRAIGCDFYCASLHKWLSAPCGSGFLYVKRQRQSGLQSHMTSWGRSLGGRPERWQDHMNWLGTRDPAPFLAVPSAIEFLEQAGMEGFRTWTHQLAQTARNKLESLFGQPALLPDSPEWYGSMIAVPLPASSYKKPKPNAMHPIQQVLRERFRIEVPVMEYCGHFFLRVSFHLYNTTDDIDRLIQALVDVRAT
jgi:isopenicillin-N epimerase